MSFSGKVVLVTGAGSGIGRGVAEYFAARGASLSLVDMNEAALRETVTRCKGDTLHTIADLTRDDQVAGLIQRTVDRFRKLDVVVNCAGIFKKDGITSDSLMDVWDQTMSINLRATVSVSHFAAAELIKTQGCIVNISSVAAIYVETESLAYQSSKVDHFSRNAAAELAPKGVRVNCIQPGAVKTNILRNIGMRQTDIDEYSVEMLEAQPLKRKVEVSDIASAVGFLASKEAACITGACIPVDSGLLLRGMALNINTKQAHRVF